MIKVFYLYSKEDDQAIEKVIGTKSKKKLKLLTEHTEAKRIQD